MGLLQNLLNAFNSFSSKGNSFLKQHTPNLNAIPLVQDINRNGIIKTVNTPGNKLNEVANTFLKIPGGIGTAAAAPILNRRQNKVEALNDLKRTALMRQFYATKNRDLLNQASQLNNVQSNISRLNPEVINPEYAKRIGGGVFDYATLGAIPAVGLTGELAKFAGENALKKLIAYNLLRAAEGGIYTGGRQLATEGKVNPRDVARGAVGGALLNTVLSPRLTGKAGKEAVNNFTNSFKRDASGKLPSKPGFIKVLPDEYTNKKLEKEFLQERVDAAQSLAGEDIYKLRQRIERIANNPNKDVSQLKGFDVIAENFRTVYPDATDGEIADLIRQLPSRKDISSIKLKEPKENKVGTTRPISGKGLPEATQPSIEDIIAIARGEGSLRQPGTRLKENIPTRTRTLSPNARQIPPAEIPTPEDILFAAQGGRSVRVKGRNTEADVTKNIRFWPNQEAIAGKPAGLGTKIRRAVATSGEAELRKMGEAGLTLADKMRSQRVEEDIMRGGAEAAIQETWRPLSRKQAEATKAVLNGKLQTSDSQVLEAALKTREILDEFAGQAEKAGLEIALPTGEKIPFKRQDAYFPRVYKQGQLEKIKPAQRERLLKHLVETGQARNIADADKMLETFIKGQGQRRAGNLEFARTLDLPLKEVSPEQALYQYVGNASRRLTESNFYGKGDEVAKDIIEGIRQAGGDHQYAQEVFDLFTGQKHYRNTFVDNAVKFNYITKLDLGAITNATQPVNTAIKTGIWNTLKGVVKAYGTPKVAGSSARAGGAITDALTKQDLDQMSIGKVMEGVLSPFSFVERKNRTVSFKAGEDFVKEMANKLEKNPTSKLAIRQLKSVGLDPEAIMTRGLTPEDILLGAKMTSDVTQFTVTPLDVPPGWKTNIGRLIAQFKSFSFQQTKFVRDEVIKEARHGNLTPLIRLIALAVPASFLAQGARNLVTGRTETDESKSLDIRKWDKYLKAFGTLPTDYATQVKFLADTYKNKYASPLKKVGRTVSSIGGATAGEIFNVINALEQVGTQKENNKDLPKGKKPADPYLDLKRVVASDIPFVGEYIKNKAFSYPTDNKSDFTRVIEAIKNNDQGGLVSALNTYKPETRKATLKRALEAVSSESPTPSNPNNIRSVISELLDTTPKNIPLTGNATIDAINQKKNASSQRSEITKQINDLAKMASEGLVPVADVEREIKVLQAKYKALSTSKLRKIKAPKPKSSRIRVKRAKLPSTKVKISTPKLKSKKFKIKK